MSSSNFWYQKPQVFLGLQIITPILSSHKPFSLCFWVFTWLSSFKAYSHLIGNPLYSSKESSARKEFTSHVGDLGSVPGLGRSLEKGKATHSSILAWRIPWTPVCSNMHACSVVQSCLTLCDPMNCSPPGSPVHGIFQARILEWVAISFSTTPV